MHSERARYQNTVGVLTIDDQGIHFSRSDGLFSRKERLMASIPFDAIVDVHIEGQVFKSLVLMLDRPKVSGFSRREFKVKIPKCWLE